MVEIRFPDKGSVSQLLDLYKEKLEGGILPPDPARTVEALLRVPVSVEHLLPIPPILEKVHSDFTGKLIESLPRLPMTSDFPVTEWRKWIKEEFKL
jgi:hypothetical protein